MTRQLCLAHTNTRKDAKKVEVPTTAVAVRSIPYPVSSCQESRQYALLLIGHPGTTKLPTMQFSPMVSIPSSSYNCSSIQVTRYQSQEIERRTQSPHTPVSISTSWEILRLELPTRPAHASSCKLPDACCKGASSSTAGRPSRAPSTRTQGLHSPKILPTTFHT